MFTTLSTVRRFHVISFVLAAVCFAALFLCWQSPAVGQYASGEENASVPVDVGENNSGGEEDKQANSNGQGKSAKGAAMGTHNNDPIPWNEFFYICGIYILLNVVFIILRFFGQLLWDIAYFTCRMWLIDNNKTDELKKLANECIKIRTANSENNSENTLPVSVNVVDQVLKDYNEEDNSNQSNWLKDWINTFNPLNWISAKRKMQIPASDIYLLLISNPQYDENDLKERISIHKNSVWGIFWKRCPSYVWKRTVDFFGWNIVVQIIVIACFAILKYRGYF